MNFIDTIFSLQDDEYVDITQEQLEEVRKRGARKGRLRVLSQLDENTKNELRKKEILTYARRNKAPVPPPPAPVPPPQAKEAPPQPTKEVPPPPPPSMHDLLPKPMPTNEELRLNIDVSAMIGKMNMSVPVVEMCKIPSVRREVLKALKVPDEAEDPPVILNTMYHGQQREENPPFYLSLGVNGLRLNNCMLDSRSFNKCDVLEGHETTWFENNPPIWKCLWH
jgi:hypothetical protein